jgi:dihydrolipoamide dehydrogenase
MKDLLIIGAGPGGYELALAASKAGLSTILIEKAEVGGTCLHHGCIPTKAYYKTASILKEAKAFSDYGIEGDFRFDFSRTLARKNQIVNDLTTGIKFLLNKGGVELVYGEAVLESANRVRVNDEFYEAKNLVIATGSRAAGLPFLDAANPDIITATEILSEKNPPKKLVIIGGGVIGIEIASIFNLFGSEVEVIEMLDTILPALDREISRRLLAYLKAQGIKFHLSSRVEAVQGRKVLFSNNAGEQTLSFDKLLLAVGRKPNIENLGLEKVGIRYDKTGIIVNENFQTIIPNIYAIGDVTGKMLLAHSATYSGFQVLKHILNEEERIDFSILPSCVFTFPEVASVGLTEEECRELNYRVAKYQFKANGKAQTMGETDGFVKMLIVDNLIKGVHILGPHASDLIHEAVVLLAKQATIDDLHNFIHAHPTLSEVIGHCN